MIRPNLSKWEYKSELEGLLVFAQSIQEMLFHHTIDTYKAPALNTHTNLLELRFLARRLIENKGSFATLDHVLDELELRIKEDPIIKAKNSRYFFLFLSRINSVKKKPEELYSLTKAFISEIERFYWELLLQTISEKVHTPKNKKDIISCATIFITEAELLGFSREYVYFVTNRFFFDKGDVPTIKSCDQINDYLSIFNIKPQEWQVIFKGSEGFQKLKSTQELMSTKSFEINISSELPTGVSSKNSKEPFFKGTPGYPTYMSIKLKDNQGILEPYGARSFASNIIETITDIYFFLTHDEKFDLFDDTYVINTINKETCVLTQPIHQMKCGVHRYSDSEKNAGIRFYIGLYSGNIYDYPSTIQLKNSLHFHRAALESKTIENQLLDLWASLEGLIPNPSDENARIVSYVNQIIPSQILSYPYKIFNDLADDLFHEGESISKIINSIKVGDSILKKTAAISVCEDLVAEREKIYSLLEKNPLLKYRLYDVHEHFSSKKRIKASISYHKDKVSRHIQRIYNSRNQIVHNTETLPYISTLVENLHAYFDTLTKEMEMAAVKSRTLLGISSILNILSVKEQEYFQRLDGKEDETITSENFEHFIFC